MCKHRMRIWFVCVVVGLALMVGATASRAAGSRNAAKAKATTQAIQEGPDVLPPKLRMEFLTPTDHVARIQYCPSSNSLCMACHNHARLTACVDCDYLVHAYRDNDGVIHCVWAPYRALKNYR